MFGTGSKDAAKRPVGTPAAPGYAIRPTGTTSVAAGGVSRIAASSGTTPASPRVKMAIPTSATGHSTSSGLTARLPSSRSLLTGSTAAKEATSSTSTAAAVSGAAALPPRKDKLKFSLKDMHLHTTVGTGTFGRVRVVQYKPTKQWYAMKILKKSEIIRLKQVDHIKSEVKILSMISHPFIVNLIGNTQDERRMYLLFEYVPGGELFSYLRKEGRFGNDHARLYAAEIILAFEYLHSMNIVYRDLKPENLLLSAKGHMKITDFGFAKVVEDRTWTLCGTPEYLAPEIIQSKGHNKGVDWWAVGILIYEMLAGYPPFFDDTPFGIYQKILAGKLDFPKHFSLEAKDLVRKLLTADRTKRLGCLRGGAADIREHAWFTKLDWAQVLAASIPAPFVPKVRDEKDTSNFDDYPDSDGDTAGRLSSKEAELFVEFDSF